MFDGCQIVAALEAAGVTHVVWIPDSDLGTWDTPLANSERLSVVRVCREGEAFAVAAGLWLGGKKPVIVMQCTGLFEAGDSLRNIIHDLQLPLFFIVGVRSAKAHGAGASADTCPVFAEPILNAWQIPYVNLDDRQSVSDLMEVYRQTERDNRARAVLIAE